MLLNVCCGCGLGNVVVVWTADHLIGAVRLRVSLPTLLQKLKQRQPGGRNSMSNESAVLRSKEGRLRPATVGNA